MPLRDHFHPPLSDRRKWEGVHSMWTGTLTASLNGGLLPPDHFAEPQVSLGRVDVDVATQHDSRNGVSSPAPVSTTGGVATKTAPVWTPARHTLEMVAEFPDEIEVLVYSTEAGPTLVGAIELVSPRNKDRPAARRAFAMKCLTYLQAGIGLVIVDVVTARHANLHDEMADLIVGDAPRFPGSPGLYAVAYRPFKRGEEERIGVWPVELTLGAALPVLPLWLRNHETAIRIDLESAYVEACQKCAIE